MRSVSRRAVLGGVAAAGLPAFARAAKTLRVASPDGQVVATFDPTAMAWTLAHRGRAVLDASPLGLRLADGRRLGPGATLLKHDIRPFDRSWTPPYGIRTRYQDRSAELIATFVDAASHIRFAVVLRVSDGSAAIRYRLLSAPGDRVVLGGEESGFRFVPGTTIVASRDEGDYATAPQTAIVPTPHPDLTACGDRGALSDLPVTAILLDGTCATIAESDRRHYPRAMLKSGALGLTTMLMHYPGRATSPTGPGSIPAEPDVVLATPAATPWRVVILAGTPAQLIERADIVSTLATPNRLGDVSWVRPGRAYRIRSYTTAAAIDAIDFAVRRRLDYVEFDWRWYGDGVHDDSDATRSIPAIDIPAITAYGRARGIGLILYVDRIPATTQLDAILRVYRGWGVAGIKFGFLWEGPQSNIDVIEDLVRRCGEAGMIVDLHDDLRPAGLERTYPNYLTLEGVRGNEQFPSARHNVTLPFTRNVAGPIDYTICYAQPRNRTTNAPQLAMAVVYYSPLAFLYWYDDTAKYRAAPPALAVFDECPTVWDETRGLSGAIGDHVVVARRSGARWFVGAMTNEAPRTLPLALDFLVDGTWLVRRFADGAAAAQASAMPVAISQAPVTARDTLTLHLAPSGGQALIFTRQG